VQNEGLKVLGTGCLSLLEDIYIYQMKFADYMAVLCITLPPPYYSGSIMYYCIYGCMILYAYV
jgi:hypothetical protein